ncbi:PilW family protein [Solimonas terrae]|uniref:Prepilin-type N-terminal cleavage/methylation domain-containing protein n=1 Tax=Solimonas terrae TaxID=1396819 RepID=A0A6M2BVP8_9GAMM|nr:PilW family protein [Solimonas terrae]NGY06281.1 prepilin-type N-terminal cleavage/methylation domain-containing protein [Solimonas terrae]
MPFARQRGFSLIELMIAMVLGLVVIGGATSVFLSNKQSYRSNQALGQVQENARIAFELIARDVRQAGLTGCGNSGRVGNVLNNAKPAVTTPAWYVDFDTPIRGYNDGDNDPAVTTGTGSAQRISTTDSLALIGANPSALSIAEHNLTTPGFRINESSPGLLAGDIIIVCDPDHAAITQITSISGSTYVIASPTTVTPGNCSSGLGYPTVCTGNSYQFAVNSQLAKLLAVDWYIGTNPQGTKSLYRKTLVNSGGTPTPTAQEMVRNVTDMQITYHVPGIGNDSFRSADALSTANWAAADIVRLSLTLEGVERHTGTDSKPISRTMTTTITMRNRAN